MGWSRKTQSAVVSPMFAVGLLIFLAFAGSLSLAFFAFDSPQRETALRIPPNESLRPSGTPRMPAYEPALSPHASTNLKLQVATATTMRIASTTASRPDESLFGDVETSAPNQSSRVELLDLRLAAGSIASAPLLPAPPSVTSAQVSTDALQTASIPEPNAALLCAIGFAALGALRLGRLRAATIR